MIRIKTNYLLRACLSFVTLLSSVSFAQSVNMGDPGFPQSSPAPCNTFGVGGNNFFLQRRLGKQLYAQF